MTTTGVTSPNISNRVAVSDNLLVNRNGSTGLQTVNDLATQISGSGPIADQLSELRTDVEGASAGLVSLPTWVLLASVSGTREGQPGRVPTTDAGTHVDPVVGGAAVKNSGEYSWRVGHGWQRTSDTFDVASFQVDIDTLDDKTALLDRDVPAPYQFVVKDAQGKVIFALDGEGLMRVIGTRIGDAFIRSTGGVGSAAWLDKQGRSSVMIDANGRNMEKQSYVEELDFGHLSGGYFRNFPRDLRRKPDGYVYDLIAETILVMSYGQSLSVGYNSTALSTAGKNYADALMFNGGVRPSDGGGTSASQHASLVPLVEATYAGSGETPVSGACQMIRQRLIADAHLNVGDHRFQMVGVAPGQSGVQINQLTSGQNWQKVVDAVTYGKSLSNTASRTFDIPFFLWLQGESNAEVMTPADVYTAQLTELRDNITNLRKRICGRDELVSIITYQTASHLQSGDPTAGIALAQLQASLDYERVFLGTPAYPFDYDDDGYHMQNTGYLHIGAYLGLCAYRTSIQGQMWSPLRPISAIRQGNRLLVRFHVPRPPIQFKTTVTAAIDNRGFTLLDPTGAAMTITDVQIAGPDLISIGASAGIAAGSFLCTGMNGTTLTGRLTGPRTNICDSQGNDIIFDPTGSPYPMDNYCVISKRKL